MGRTADTDVPGQIAAGESLWVEITLADFPAPSHTITLNLDGPGTYSIAGTVAADGTSHNILVAGSDTQAWIAGFYSWRIMATETAGGIVTMAQNGGITVIGPSPALANARATLAAVEATILSRASNPNADVTVGGDLRQQYISNTELIKMRIHWRNEVFRLERFERAQLGIGSTVQTFAARFDNNTPGRTLYPRPFP